MGPKYVACSCVNVAAGGGAAFDTVTETAVDVVELPAASSATAVSDTAPFAAFVVSQLIVNGAVVTLPSDVVPARNSTLATPLSSVAVAVTAVEPLTVAPAAGAESATAGATISGAVAPRSMRPYSPLFLTADARREVQGRRGLVAARRCRTQCPTARGS